MSGSAGCFAATVAWPDGPLASRQAGSRHPGHRSAHSAETRGYESAIRAIASRDSGRISARRVSEQHAPEFPANTRLDTLDNTMLLVRHRQIVLCLPLFVDADFDSGFSIWKVDYESVTFG